ncbi:MAG: MBL fold metallo-hydrolase [Candidatus Nanohaloarchaea archaeon]
MRVEVLGNVQDGGVPHLGCECDVCEAAREDPREQRYVGALMLKETSDDNTVRYLIDATPDIRFQIKGDYLDGVFVSHGHLGHVAGLPFFGTECLDTDDLPVYCTPEMRQFLMNNDPFRLLSDRNQIEINEVKNGEKVEIQGGSVEIRNVLHRYVNTDTVSFMIQGEEEKLFYMSDIDEWTGETIESVKEADIAIVDGTFWDKQELDRYEEVPHPTIEDTMDRMEDFDTDIYFIHMNHTNPVLREGTEEREEMQARGFDIVEKGDTFEI